jgi:predicted GIY-YIG superfamily endonuclease
MPRFYVYILHTDSKLADHAQHYCGATDNLLRRLVQHARGQGARITQAFKENGIGWRLATVYVMEHRCQFLAERRVKKRKNCCVFCGVCAGDEIACIRGATSVDVSTLGIPLTSAELAAVNLNQFAGQVADQEQANDDEFPPF